jgi:adenine-specific DNA-methyltransferase
MAKVEDLIGEIADARLRSEVAREVAALKKQKKFGLVFEEHIPEQILLPSLPVKEGLRVAKRGGNTKEAFLVETVYGNGKVRVRRESGVDEEETIRAKDLVVIKRFGEPIYPTLVPVAQLIRAEGRPFHTIINADNFHALQLLLYCHAGQVDLIYIDPPYNTGARDWKYNNDYVDSNDQYRHSKWLAMMKRRLMLAKRLLNPDTGVLIVTIDEHEVHHLGVLLEGVFPACARQMVTIVINQKGVAQGRLARVEEYALVVFMPKAFLKKHHDDLLSPEERRNEKRFMTPRWEWLLRGGNNSRREDRPGLFYPIHVDPVRKTITGVGEVLPLEEKPDLRNAADGTAAWPIRTNGSLGNWQLKPATLRGLIKGGFVKLGGFDKNRGTWTVLYLNSGTRVRIEKGEIRIVGRDSITGAVEVEFANEEARQRNIKTVWHRGTHDSGIYGSSVLRSVVGDGVNFPFPKSLYSVRDAIGAIVRDKPNALILDFFAGSGTTFHATCLLNVEDGGHRRCILVTNNEVNEKQTKRLNEQGYWPGDPEFEQHGICESVTWPRCEYATQGHRDDGTPLPGMYLDGKEMKEGFQENLEYLRLDFLDPHEVAYGEKFEAILPILWLMAGAKGERETARGFGKWFIPKNSPYAVLIREEHFAEFKRELQDRSDITLIFLVTDSEEAFREMSSGLAGRPQTRMLYKSYLDNFRINVEKSL